MKPLRETIEGSDPNEKFGSALLTQVGPLEPSAARKRRVWNALEARSRVWTRWLRPVVTGGVVLGLCTGASAMVGRYWMAQRRAPESEMTAPRSLDPPHIVLRPAAPSEAIAEPVPEPAQRAPSAPLPASRGREAKKRAAIPTESAPSGLAAVLMVEAMQARRAGELARAAELASEYRRRYPEGALKEEALALSIEVAVARNNGEAARLAEQYMQQFPRGRFRSQAERALHAIPR